MEISALAVSPSGSLIATGTLWKVGMEVTEDDGSGEENKTTRFMKCDR